MPSQTRNQRSGALRSPRPRASPARRRRPHRHPRERTPAGQWRRRAPRRLEPARASPTPVSRLGGPRRRSIVAGHGPRPMIRARWRWRSGRLAGLRVVVRRLGPAQHRRRLRARAPAGRPARRAHRRRRGRGAHARADPVRRGPARPAPGPAAAGHDQCRERLDRRGGGEGRASRSAAPGASPGRPRARLGADLRAAAPGAARGRDGPGRRLAGHRRRRPGGRMLGLVGLGRLGSRVARIGLASGSRCWPGRRTSTRPCPAAGVEPVSKDELLARADVVSLRLRLSDRTRGIVGPRTWPPCGARPSSSTPPGGPLDDEAALLQRPRTRRGSPERPRHV